MCDFSDAATWIGKMADPERALAVLETWACEASKWCLQADESGQRIRPDYKTEPLTTLVGTYVRLHHPGIDPTPLFELNEAAFEVRLPLPTFIPGGDSNFAAAGWFGVVKKGEGVRFAFNVGDRVGERDGAGGWADSPLVVLRAFRVYEQLKAILKVKADTPISVARVRDALPGIPPRTLQRWGVSGKTKPKAEMRRCLSRAMERADKIHRGRLSDALEALDRGKLD